MGVNKNFLGITPEYFESLGYTKDTLAHSITNIDYIYDTVDNPTPDIYDSSAYPMDRLFNEIESVPIELFKYAMIDISSPSFKGDIMIPGDAINFINTSITGSVSSKTKPIYAAIKLDRDSMISLQGKNLPLFNQLCKLAIRRKIMSMFLDSTVSATSPIESIGKITNSITFGNDYTSNIVSLNTKLATIDNSGYRILIVKPSVAAALRRSAVISGGGAIGSNSAIANLIGVNDIIELSTLDSDIAGVVLDPRDYVLGEKLLGEHQEFDVDYNTVKCVVSSSIVGKFKHTKHALLVKM